MNILSAIMKKNNNKGLISTYMLMLLSVTMLICSVYVQQAKQNLEFYRQLETFHQMNQAEVMTILKIKNMFDTYNEKDFYLDYENCMVNVHFNEEKAEITIECEDYTRTRILEYDQIEGFVTEYH